MRLSDFIPSSRGCAGRAPGDFSDLAQRSLMSHATDWLLAIGLFLQGDISIIEGF